MVKKKVLLMGRSGSGKTSMRSIIFADYLARDTTRLSATIDVEYSQVRFLGNLHLHLWDCGGQNDFYSNYLGTMREHIFRSVELLIYVIDVDSSEPDEDWAQFEDVLVALDASSPDARVYVLVHKMDLVAEEHRHEVFAAHEARAVSAARGLAVKCFQTSIWDETLYRAWSHIVHSLVPNTALLEDNLKELCALCGSDEAVLFESTTFLVVASATLKPQPDIHRFEKISNIVKQFKLSCRKAQAQFEGMVVRRGGFRARIDAFTKNTCVMLIASDSAAEPAAVALNVAAARPLFERLIPASSV